MRKQRISSCLDSIITKASRYKLLTPEEEIQLSYLIQRLAVAEANYWQVYSPDESIRKDHQKAIQEGKKAREKMINSNQKLVISFARKYSTYAPLEDLFQEGCFGVIKAAEKFDPKRGYKFSTFASRWILHYVRRYLSDCARTIRYPCHKVESLHKLAKFRSIYERHNGQPPTIETAAEYMEVTCERIYALISLPVASSFETWESDETRPLTPVCPREPLLDAVHQRQVKEILATAIHELPSFEEREVIRLRYGIDATPLTIIKTGEVLGFNRDKVRRLEKSGLKRLAKNELVQGLAIAL